MQNLKNYTFLICGYFLANLVRLSASVAMPPLASSMSMDAGLVGFVTGLFFYAYAMMQPFCGNICDNKGPFFACGIGQIVMGLGLFIFAVAPSPFWLGTGRFIGGIGAAPSFTALLVFQANAFSKSRYAVFAAVTTFIGHTGEFVAVTPLGFAFDNFGRIWTFCSLSFFALLLGIVMILMCEKKTNRAQPNLLQPEDRNWRKILKNVYSSAGFRSLFGSRQIQAITLAWSAEMVLQMTLIGLWGVHWLSTCTGLSVFQARQCMTFAVVGIMIGALAGGGIYSVFRGKRNALLGISFGMALGLSLFLYGAWVQFSFVVMVAISLLMGLFMGMCKVACSSNLNEVTHHTAMGSVVGAVNTVIFLFVVIGQFGSGAIINLFTANSSGVYSATGYTVSFSFLLIFIILVLIPVKKYLSKTLETRMQGLQ